MRPVYSDIKHLKACYLLGRPFPIPSLNSTNGPFINVCPSHKGPDTKEIGNKIIDLTEIHLTPDRLYKAGFLMPATMCSVLSSWK